MNPLTAVAAVDPVGTIGMGCCSLCCCCCCCCPSCFVPTDRVDDDQRIGLCRFRLVVVAAVADRLIHQRMRCSDCCGCRILPWLAVAVRQGCSCSCCRKSNPTIRDCFAFACFETGECAMCSRRNLRSRPTSCTVLLTVSLPASLRPSL